MTALYVATAWVGVASVVSLAAGAFIGLGARR